MLFFRLIVRTVREMSDDDATHMAAGVAYYAVFSLFPLLIGLIAILNLLPASEIRQAQLTEFVSEYLPGSEGLLKRDLEVGGALGVIAIFGLLWSGSAIFGAVARVVNRAWDIQKDRPIYIGKPRQMGMALVVGLMFLTSLGASTFVSIAEEYALADLPAPAFLVETSGRVFLQVVSFSLMLFTFLMIYKMLPNTRTYWRYVWPGALVAAVLFEIGKASFLLYVERFARLPGRLRLRGRRAGPAALGIRQQPDPDTGRRAELGVRTAQGGKGARRGLELRARGEGEGVAAARILCRICCTMPPSNHFSQLGRRPG